MKRKGTIENIDLLLQKWYDKQDIDSEIIINDIDGNDIQIKCFNMGFIINVSTYIGPFKKLSYVEHIG